MSPAQDLKKIPQSYVIVQHFAETLIAFVWFFWAIAITPLRNLYPFSIVKTYIFVICNNQPYKVPITTKPDGLRGEYILLILFIDEASLSLISLLHRWLLLLFMENK